MWKLFDPKIRKYKGIRAMGVPLMTGVGKTLPRDLILQAAKDLRMLGKDGKTIRMDAEDEVDFLMDRAIHDIPWPQERWIERICSRSIEGYAPREQVMLRAQSQAYFSLYEIAAVEARGLRLRDLFDGREIPLVDLGLAATAQKGGLLATRVVALEGLCFTSGVGMPFPARDKEKLVGNFAALFEKKKSEMAGERYFERGEEYFSDGSVRGLVEHEGVITAKVHGTRSYRVKLWAEDGGLDYSCTCPLGAGREFCKHCVAVGLTWLSPSRDDGRAAGKPAVGMKDVGAFLAAQSNAVLVKMLMDQAMDDERLRRRLLLKAAAWGRGKMDLATYRNVIDAAVDTDGFVDYHEAGDYAEGIEEAVDSVEELLKEGHAAQAVELVEHALQAVERAIDSVDDSGGRVGGILERLHRAAPLPVGDEHAMGHVEAVVAIKKRDLSSAYAYLEIAEAYKRARKLDRALEWAEKGAKAFPTKTDSRLGSFLAEEYDSGAMPRRWPSSGPSSPRTRVCRNTAG